MRLSALLKFVIWVKGYIYSLFLSQKTMATKKTATAKDKALSRPKQSVKDNATVHSAQKWTKPGDQRKTYIVSSDLVDKIDTIAFMDRTTVKHVVNEAFTDHVDKWEKANGPLMVPKKK